MAAELFTAGLLALLASASPSVGATERSGSACTLRLTAERSRLEPSDPRTVRIRLAAQARPALSASVGRIDGLAADGEGSWTAQWTAPEAGIPRVALVTALAGDDCGWLAVPLTGVGEVVVRTQPGARVLVRIAEREFGPADAGPDGVALVPVEVPPGVTSVLHGRRRIPFDVPPVVHAALAIRSEVAPADREQVIPVLLVAVDAAGGPRPGPPPALTVSAGRIGEPVSAGPGAWRAAWILPPGPTAEVSASARLPGDPDVELRLPRPAGPPARLEAVLDRAIASPDDPPLAVTIVVRDAASNPAEGEVTGSTDAGQVSAAERVGPGEYRLVWTPPQRLEGRDHVALALRAGAAETRIAVALRPGAPASLRLRAPRAVMTADGADALAIEAEVLDLHGNPIERGPSRASASGGDLGAPRRSGPGLYVLSYRPRRVTAWASDEVLVELPPLSARLPLRLRPPLPRLELGASAGLALRPGPWFGLQAGAEVSSWRWLADQEAGLVLGAAFSRFHDSRSVTAGAGSARFVGQVQILGLLASASWRRSVGRAVALRLDAGGGAARVESSVAVGGGPLVPEARWVPAASAAASIGLSAWRGRAVLVLRGTWLPDAHLASLRGAATPISLSLGYEFDAH